MFNKMQRKFSDAQKRPSSVFLPLKIKKKCYSKIIDCKC